MTVVASPEPPRLAAGTRLYTVGQLTVGTILGSPLVGFWFAAQNFQALGDHRRERHCRILGIGLLMLNLTLAVLVPDRVPSAVVWLPFVIATKVAGDYWFGQTLWSHWKRGGAVHSWWRVLGWGLLGGLALAATIFAIVFALEAFAPETFERLGAW